MPINPNIALQVQPPQTPDLAAGIGNALTLQQMLQQRDMNQMKLTALRQEMDDERKVRDILTRHDGRIDSAMPELLSAVGERGLKIAEMKAAQDEAIAKADKAQLDAMGARGAMLGQQIGAILSAPEPNRPALYKQVVQSLMQQGVITGETMEQIPAEYPGDDILQWQYDSTLTMQQQIERRQKEAEAKRQETAQAETGRHNIAMETKQAEPTGDLREFKEVFYPGYLEETGKPKSAKTEMEAWKEFQKSKSATAAVIPGRDVPYPPEVEAQRKRLNPPGGAAQASSIPESVIDPTSQSILAQTGLSYPAFMVITGQMGSLPRDVATRRAAMTEAQQWANTRGVDVSTIGSQYKTYNEVLSRNIARVNNTKIMEAELQGTIENLQGVVNDKDLKGLRFVNVAKVWAGQEVNDSLAQQYAMHLYQLRTELAAYGAATQGRSGNEINIADLREAETTIKNGISSGSLQGLATAVANSTEKMKGIMDKSVQAARKAVWDLFGVGQNFKAPTEGQGPQRITATNPQTGEQVESLDGGKTWQKVKK